MDGVTGLERPYHRDANAQNPCSPAEPQACVSTQQVNSPHNVTYTVTPSCSPPLDRTVKKRGLCASCYWEAVFGSSFGSMKRLHALRLLGKVGSSAMSGPP